MKGIRRIAVQQGPGGLVVRARWEEQGLEAAALALILAAWGAIVAACLHDLATLGGIRLRGGGLATSFAPLAFFALVTLGFGAAVGGILLWKLSGRDTLRVRDGRLRQEIRWAGLMLLVRELDLSKIVGVDYAILARGGTVVQIHVGGGKAPWGFAAGASAEEAARTVKELRALLPPLP